MAISWKVAQLARERRFTITDLAETTGLSSEMLQQLYTNVPLVRSSIGLADLEILARALGVKIKDLFVEFEGLTEHENGSSIDYNHDF